MVLDGTAVAVLDERLAAAIDLELVRGPHPSAIELLSLARVSGAVVRASTVCQGGSLTGAALCVLEPTQVNGLSLTAYRMFGGSLHDYTRLYHRDESALERLFYVIEQDARDRHADVVILDNILSQAGEKFPARWHASEQPTAVFDAALTRKGWSDLYCRKSVHQAVKKARQRLDYRVTHTVGEFAEQAIAELAQLHVERRHFDDETSAFEAAARRAEYLAHRSNKLLTTVWLGTEILGRHYGMLYDNALLWHTPVINIKYLALSPLQVLLAETCIYCESSGFRYLDLGLGDESYKSRFSNTQRRVSSLMLPLSARGHLAALSRATNAGVRIRAQMRRLRGFGGYLQRRASRMNNRLVWLERVSPVGQNTGSAAAQVVTFVESFEAYVVYCRQRGLEPKRWQYDRFRRGAAFVALYEEDKLTCSGWLMRDRAFEVPETGDWISCAGSVLMFDLQSSAWRRGQGYLEVFMDQLAAKMPGQKLVTYVRFSDTSRRRSMRLAGFRVIPPPITSEQPAGSNDASP